MCLVLYAAVLPYVLAVTAGRTGCSCKSATVSWICTRLLALHDLRTCAALPLGVQGSEYDAGVGGGGAIASALQRPGYTDLSC